MNVISELKNREIAVAVWSLILLFWAFSISDVRHSLLRLLKAFFVRKIIVPFALMLFYVFLIVIFYEKVHFWDTSATKDTIFWTAGTAFATLFNLNKVVEDENYFKKAILDNIKLVLILEFIFNLYSFSLLIELVLVPIVSLIVMLNVIAKSKPEYKQVKVLLDYALALFGLVIIIFTFREIFVDFQNFATIKNLRDFFLPPLFTITFFPFVYFMALYMQYEDLFVRVDFANKNSSSTKYAKQKIFATFHLNLSKLTKFSKNVGFANFNSKGDVSDLIKKVRGQ